MLKNKQLIFIIGLFLISFLYLFLRLKSLDKLVDFNFDQATHILETKEMFDSKKISLIGPVSYAKSFMGSFILGQIIIMFWG